MFSKIYTSALIVSILIHITSAYYGAESYPISYPGMAPTGGYGGTRMAGYSGATAGTGYGSMGAYPGYSPYAGASSYGLGGSGATGYSGFGLTDNLINGVGSAIIHSGFPTLGHMILTSRLLSSAALMPLILIVKVIGFFTNMLSGPLALLKTMFFRY